MVNSVHLIGNLGKDPEVRFLADKQAVCNLRVATSRSWTDKASGQRKEEVEWHDVEVWGKQAESCGQYLKKGRLVYVEGRIKTDTWEKDGQKHWRVKIVADSVRFLPSGAGKSDQAAADPAPGESTPDAGGDGSEPF
jgi:single-strand DNA-binding protein